MTDKPNSDDEQTVTVAELMARYGVEPPAKGRAHRRRARAGGVSVAELTGEIPALTPETLAAHAEAEAAQAEAADAVAEDAPDTDADADGQTAESVDTGAADVGAEGAETEDLDAPEADDSSRATDEAVGDDADAEDAAATAQAETADADPAHDVDSAATAVFDVSADQTPKTRYEDASTDAATAAQPVSEAPTGQGDEDAHDPWRRPSGPVTVIPPIAQDFDDRWPDEPAADAAEEPQAAFTDPVEGPDEAPAARGQEQAADEAARPSFGSALRQWFGLAAQTVLGVVVGAAVFLGFIRLWDVLPYVALVLAVLVILAMAAVVRILRKTDDSVSILLAVVVGVIVTIGPLVFVLSSP